jgi:hypothetical protein
MGGSGSPVRRCGELLPPAHDARDAAALGQAWRGGRAGPRYPGCGRAAGGALTLFAGTAVAPASRQCRAALSPPGPQRMTADAAAVERPFRLKLIGDQHELPDHGQSRT